MVRLGSKWRCFKPDADTFGIEFEMISKCSLGYLETFEV